MDLKKHVEENDITRPEVYLRRSPTNQNLRYLSYKQQTESCFLDDLVEPKGIDFNEMLSEVEAIVLRHKINIDYFLNEVMDQDVIQISILTSRRLKSMI